MKIKIRSTNNILKKLGKKTLVALATFILVILPVTLLILFNSPKGVEAAWPLARWATGPEGLLRTGGSPEPVVRPGGANEDWGYI